jgi:hypothetical protein
MNSSVSATRAADPPVRREGTLAVALLLGFAGGYLYTYTWITHGILANAQTHLPRLTLSLPATALFVVVLLCRAWRPADVAHQAE